MKHCLYRWENKKIDGQWRSPHRCYLRKGHRGRHRCGIKGWIGKRCGVTKCR